MQTGSYVLALANVASRRRRLSSEMTSRRWAGPVKLLPLERTTGPECIYGQHLVRGNTSCDIGPTGAGKTTLAYVEAVAIATGRPLLGVMPQERAKVWILAGEDDIEEAHRRLRAVLIHHDIPEQELDEFLFLDAVHERPVVLAFPGHVDAGQVQALIDRVRRDNISLVVLDPLTAFHRFTAEDNPSFERFVKDVCNVIAHQGSCAVRLLHHPRKIGEREMTWEDSRGGGALVSGCRSANVMRPLNSDEARAFGIEPAGEGGPRYARILNDKNNHFPRGRVDWVQLVGVRLPDGTVVATATAWAPPSRSFKATNSDLRRIQDRIAAGRPDGKGWRHSERVVDKGSWAGQAIADAVGLDIAQRFDLIRVRALLEDMIAQGLLKKEERYIDRHKKVPMVEVGQWVDE